MVFAKLKNFFAKLIFFQLKIFLLRNISLFQNTKKVLAGKKSTQQKSFLTQQKGQIPNTVLLKRSQVDQNCQQKPRPGMDEGWSQVSQTTFIEIRSDASLNKVVKSLFFQRRLTSRLVLMNISWSNVVYVFKSSQQNLMTFLKLVLDLKSVHPSLILYVYWHFLETRYAETKIFETIKNKQTFKSIFLNIYLFWLV